MGQVQLKKYNYVYDRDGEEVTFSINKELDEHLKRHLDMMAKGKHSNTDIVRWLKKRGFKEALFDVS